MHSLPVFLNCRDRPVILRYRIVLHRGELAPVEIGRLQAEYAGETIAQ